MTSRERARKWITDDKRPSIILAEEACANSLATLLDAHADERVREALAKIDEIMREVVAGERNSADEQHREGNYEEEDIYEHAGNTVQRLREQISALLKEVVSNG